MIGSFIELAQIGPQFIETPILETVEALSQGVAVSTSGKSRPRDSTYSMLGYCGPLEHTLQPIPGNRAEPK